MNQSMQGLAKKTYKLTEILMGIILFVADICAAFGFVVNEMQVIINIIFILWLILSVNSLLKARLVHANTDISIVQFYRNQHYFFKNWPDEKMIALVACSKVFEFFAGVMCAVILGTCLYHYNSEWSNVLKLLGFITLIFFLADLFASTNNNLGDMKRIIVDETWVSFLRKKISCVFVIIFLSVYFLNNLNIFPI